MSKRAIRIVGVSGFAGDSPDLFKKNLLAASKDANGIDAVIGDSLAEFNLSISAIGQSIGKHPGWEANFMTGLKDSLSLVNELKCKVVSDGGGLNPKGAAIEIQSWIDAAGYDLKVAYVDGDLVTKEVSEQIARGESIRHLDGDNTNVSHANASQKAAETLQGRKIISANCYLGSRAITAALEAGADIVVCGRVADASPVMGLAAWWHGWEEDNYDAYGGALVAGHLIECSGYSTGGNFSGFERYSFERDLTDIGMPIAEVAHDGTCVITKPESLPGLVNVETIKAHFLYELQGTKYLNSDVAARCRDIAMSQQGPSRVLVTGVKGMAPPATTKCAIFWIDGYQVEYMIGVTGSNYRAKAALFKQQTEFRLKKLGILDKLSMHEVQEYGIPEPNASSQFRGTSFIRCFVQAPSAELVSAVMASHASIGLEHFSGYHSTIMTNPAQGVPRIYLGYYPGLWDLSKLDVGFTLIGKGGLAGIRTRIDRVKGTSPLKDIYEIDSDTTTSLVEETASVSGSDTITTELGNLVLARSGDKGGNINIGLYPLSPLNSSGVPSQIPVPEIYEWLVSYLTCDVMKNLLGDDFKPSMSIERDLFPQLKAVHFVIYGILGRGVTSTSVLDSLGKGFADWIRSRYVQAPRGLLELVKQPVKSSL
ncbi:hypothetical protein BCR37DRAFT_115738 [Protomyces lactucae-debilis]|uniref:DUF1446-domain-containing protein n=1 Tax=Protomyces lactucae-debilis TaxID=2754530 RepID=A0A1Y2F2U1_PROLT|nr:uncharacterized protein BCR37DRAFT_115738 [Protomyces lactucae-debilis]ORY78189.1 hypothetical protein BCR37DRAFT_115738 [Protomyces lactucae-debilis]